VFGSNWTGQSLKTLEFTSTKNVFVLYEALAYGDYADAVVENRRKAALSMV
jgi:hypothetical protein